MTEVNASMVKSLRDRTGAGMMACREALVEAGGNEDKAVEIIQKKGLAKVAKKAGAIAAEGLVQSYIHPGNRIGVLIEVNCQTDFVARNEDFQRFVEETAMQIASMTPLYVRDTDISETDVAERKRIFQGQIEEEERASGKARPAAAVEKIVEGQLAKWKKEVCLVDQISIMSEDGKSIQQICDEISSKTGEKVHIRRFVRYELGEGIEKKKNDLAAEVAEALKSN